MRWTHEEYLNYERRRASKIQRETPCPKPEPVVCHDPLATPQGKNGNTGKHLVRIESRRVRLIDPDNLCAKYHIDCLRYAGLIPDDSPDCIEISVTQTKVASKAEEETIIEIIPL